jgi:methylenetetrahydrofolate reductase (NADPH)
VQTQFVFDLPVFARWMQQVRDLGLDKRCHILAGVGPIRNRHALEYFEHDLPGVFVPESVSRRLRGVPEERQEEEALALCAETIQQLHDTPGVAGVHIIASGWDDFIPQVLTRAGIGPRESDLNSQGPADGSSPAPPVPVSRS